VKFQVRREREKFKNDKNEDKKEYTIDTKENHSALHYAVLSGSIFYYFSFFVSLVYFRPLWLSSLYLSPPSSLALYLILANSFIIIMFGNGTFHTLRSKRIRKSKRFSNKFLTFSLCPFFGECGDDGFVDSVSLPHSPLSLLSFLLTSNFN